MPFTTPSHTFDSTFTVLKISFEREGVRPKEADADTVTHADADTLALRFIRTLVLAALPEREPRRKGASRRCDGPNGAP